MPLAAMIAALVAAMLAAPQIARGADPPSAVDLAHAGWQYAPGETPARWTPVTLPHVTNPNPTASSFGGGVGWYRVRLRAPASGTGFAWAIRFGQVRRVAQVFLDGRRLTTHDEPYEPFSVTLPALADGRAHELRVRVDWRKGREPREGWWNWGGITRPAQLVPVGGLVVRDPGFLSRRTCDAEGRCSWSVLVDAVVANRGTAPARPTLSLALRAPGGAAAGARTVTARPLVPGERTRVRFSVPVSGDPRLWAPGHPALYDAELRTLDGDRVQQVDRARIGLRTVAVRGGVLELNGHPVQLRGASIQEDVAGHGAALTDADIAATVRELRNLGANLTRAHYALDERLLRALDAAGILVWSQAPVYHRDVALRRPAGRARALAQVRASILATRSHPAVLTHSVANELSSMADERPGTAAFLRDARAAARDLDPSVPVAVDTLSYPGFPAQRAYAAFDLLGINSYFGWYDGKPGEHSTSRLTDLAPYLRTMRRDYPRAGLVVTEFGAESTMPGPASVKETYGFQTEYARRTLAMIDAAPGISGALWWTLREFAVKPGWDGGAGRVDPLRDSIHNKGLVTYAGLRKPAFDVVRDEARRTPLYRPVAAGPAGRRGSPWPAIGLSALLVALLGVAARALLGLAAGRRAPAPVPLTPAADAEPERPPLRLVA